MHKEKSSLPHNRAYFFSTEKYWQFVEKFFIQELQNDGEDITSQFFLEKDTQRSVFVLAKENGILAGKEELNFFLEKFFPNLQKKWKKEEGENIKNGEKIFFLSGNARQIMKLERIFLNVLSRLSGIATQTKMLTLLSKNIPIAATRKTQWSFLDKKAVIIGGGLSHRIGLFDGIMIKENHILSLQNGMSEVKEKIEKLWKKNENNNPPYFFEVEVETKEEFEEIYTFFSTNKKILSLKKIIMLDNFSPLDIEILLKKYPDQKIRQQKNIFLEASGGISQKNISEYQNTRVDVLSLGSLTNNILPLDFSMRIDIS